MTANDDARAILNVAKGILDFTGEVTDEPKNARDLAGAVRTLADTLPDRPVRITAANAEELSRRLAANREFLASCRTALTGAQAIRARLPGTAGLALQEANDELEARMKLAIGIVEQLERGIVIMEHSRPAANAASNVGVLPYAVVVGLVCLVIADGSAGGLTGGQAFLVGLVLTLAVAAVAFSIESKRQRGR